MTDTIVKRTIAHELTDELGLDIGDKDQRLTLIIELMGRDQWVPKKSPADIVAILAERGTPLSHNSIERDACEAGRIVRFASDPELVRQHYWRRAVQHDTDVDKLVRDTAAMVADSVPTSPLDVKSLAEASSKALDTREKNLERVARVAGLISPNQVTVSVDGQRRVARVDELSEFFRLTWLWFETVEPSAHDRFCAWLASGGVLEVASE